MRAVLLVERSATLRRAIADVLTRNCFNVLQAGTGCDAIKVLESYPNRVDLCILNAELVETDGVELARQVLAEREGIRLLFFGRRRLGWEDDFLQEPLSPQELVATATAVLERRGPPIEGSDGIVERRGPDRRTHRVVGSTALETEFDEDSTMITW